MKHTRAELEKMSKAELIDLVMPLEDRPNATVRSRLTLINYELIKRKL